MVRETLSKFYSFWLCRSRAIATNVLLALHAIVVAMPKNLCTQVQLTPNSACTPITGMHTSYSEIHRIAIQYWYGTVGTSTVQVDMDSVYIYISGGLGTVEPRGSD